MGTAAGSKEVTQSDGIIPRACSDLFRQIELQCDNNAQVELSYLEVYNEEIRDLLAAKGQDQSSLRIRETMSGEVYVRGLQSRKVENPVQVGALMDEASARRVVASTKMNAVSSRSHAICVLKIQGVVEDGTKFESKLTLVDLAGSERIKKTGAEAKRAQEGISINKGLFVLGQVVSALSEQRPSMKRKPPYRDSKLTRLLQDSLGGNSRTIMIACVSPADFNVEESINTLRYATSARNIKNTATQNVIQSISPEEAAKLQRENALLKAQVADLQQRIERMTSEIEDLSPSNDHNPQIPEDEEMDESALAVPLTPGGSKGTLGGFLEANNADSMKNAVNAAHDDDARTTHTTKTVPELELEVQSLSGALRKAKHDMRTTMRETAVELPAIRMKMALLEDEVEHAQHLEGEIDELLHELQEVKADASAARTAANKLSVLVEEQSVQLTQSQTQLDDMRAEMEMEYDLMKMEEEWVLFTVELLSSFREKMRTLGDFFAMVVNVVNSPDILSMIPTSHKQQKRTGWGWRKAAEVDPDEEANLRQKLLTDHIQFFNERFLEIEDDINIRSISIESIQESVQKGRDKVETDLGLAIASGPRRSSSMIRERADIMLHQLRTSLIAPIPRAAKQ